MTLYIREEHHDLERPVFVLALDGWVDAGSGTAQARAALLDQIETHRIGSFEADTLIDYRARRPTMILTDGVIESMKWPSIEVRYGVDRGGNDVVFVIGPEPDTSWQAFCAEVVALAQGYDARMVVGLGAFPAPVPHTRPIKLASTAATQELAQVIGFVPGTMEVPCGIHAAIEAGCQSVGLPAIGIWARVPHYLAASSYPAAAAALVDGLACGRVDAARRRTARRGCGRPDPDRRAGSRVRRTPTPRAHTRSAIRRRNQGGAPTVVGRDRP